MQVHKHNVYVLYTMFFTMNGDGIKVFLNIFIKGILVMNMLYTFKMYSIE